MTDEPNTGLATLGTIVMFGLLCAVCVGVKHYDDPGKPSRIEAEQYFKDSLDSVCQIERAWFADHNDRCDCNCIYENISKHYDRYSTLDDDCRGSYDWYVGKHYTDWLDRTDDDGRLRDAAYTGRQ